MKRPVVFVLCAFLVAAVPAKGDPGRRSVVQQAPAQVTIDRQPPGQRLITPPGIEFPLRIQPDCAPGLALASLSISIADTRRTFRAADFEAQAVIETTLRIPQRQVGPLAIDTFCSSDPTTDDLRSTTHVADAYTASVSMRCAGDAGQSVSYDTLALEITLLCAGAEEGGNAADDAAASDNADEDQESPPLTTRF